MENSTAKVTQERKKIEAEGIPSFERYAIFQTGGKQYQALEGKTLAIEKLPENAGEKIEFHEVLLRRTSATELFIGQPYLDTPIRAVVVKQDRDAKITVFKFKRRKKYQVKQGHRQAITVVRFESI